MAAFTGERWLVADLHLEHPGIVKEREGGLRNRPFATVEEHDEAVIANWNAKVAPADKVYVLGDVAMKRKGLKKLARMNGKKYLVKGNHDIWLLEDYAEYFYQIAGCRVFQKEGFIASHIPIHPMEMERFSFNVHGHLHDKQVTTQEERFAGVVEVPDNRYLCVSLEQTQYAPVHIDTVLAVKKAVGR